MPTTVAFLPTATQVFSFQATLDGANYVVSVPWNTFGQRWYLQIVDVNNNLILYRALTGTPDPLPIAAAFWTQQTVTVTTDAPHGYLPGSTQNVTIAGLSPAAYNGQAFALITGPSTMTYPLAANPGPATIINGMSAVLPYSINLVQGYFTSTLDFYESTQTFIITP